MLEILRPRVRRMCHYDITLCVTDPHVEKEKEKKLLLLQMEALKVLIDVFIYHSSPY